MPKFGRRGISPVVAIVLIIGIVFVASVSIFWWVGGIATKQPTVQKPVPIMGTVMDSGKGYMRVAIANLGDRPLPEGNFFMVAENGIEIPVNIQIEPGTQQVFWFWGYYDKDEGFKGFEDQATIYDPISGATAPTIYTPEVAAESATAYSMFSAEGFEPSMSLIEDRNGLFWMAFTSNYSIGSHDIWIMNSTDGITWSEPFQAAVQGTLIQEDSPQLVYDGYTYYILYRSWYSGDYLRFTTSNDGNVWSVPQQTNIGFTDPDGNDYRYDGLNKRGFAFIKDDNEVFWVGYISGTSAVVRHSNDGVTWDAEITVDDSATPGKVSMLQDHEGIYWVAYVGSDDTTIEVANSTDGITWNEPVVVTDEDYGPACTGPGLMQDSNRNYFLFADMSDSCEDIYVKASVDGNWWSKASWLPNVTGSDRHPRAMQDTEGVYHLAFADASSIRVRSSDDPMIWISV